MKILTGIPLSWSEPTVSAIEFLWTKRSSPPSVVSSSFFSGTSVTRSGFISRAIPTISEVEAISRISLV